MYRVWVGLSGKHCKRHHLGWGNYLSPGDSVSQAKGYDDDSYEVMQLPRIGQRAYLEREHYGASF